MLFIRRQQLKELLDNENNELQYEIYSNLNSSNFNNYLPNNQVNNNNYFPNNNQENINNIIKVKKHKKNA
jgi:hypothetical protein